MGACNSSAALDPADIGGDGTAPVFWSPEREQEKRAAKLRETQQKQQEEIQRATGHLKHKHTHSRRNTASKSGEEEKQQADDSTVVQPVRPSRTSRPVSVSFPSPVQRPVVSKEELSDYPLPKSARRHARAASASASGMVSPTRSPEVSVSGGMRSEVDGLSTPRQQSTPNAVRRASMVPEVVKEGEERQLEEEKESEASAPLPTNTAAAAVATTVTPANTATPSTANTAVRVVSLPAAQREERAESVSSASTAFGVQLRKVPTVVKAVDTTPAPIVSAAAAS